MNHFDNLRLLTRICKETPRVICADADLFLKVDDTEPAPQGVAFIKCIAQGRPVRGGGRVASGASDVRRQGRVASGASGVRLCGVRLSLGWPGSWLGSSALPLAPRQCVNQPPFCR